jgi:demethylmenaquinone methyltransferase/2-methoxy-6-polyprenyl-1,4-benzoquinol methylase
MVDAFHHVCDQQQTAAELLRVLAPGGRLVVEEPNIETLTVKLIALAEKLALMRSHFLSPSAIAQMFRSLGAQVSIHTTPDDRLNAWLVVEHE